MFISNECIDEEADCVKLYLKSKDLNYYFQSKEWKNQFKSSAQCVSGVIQRVWLNVIAMNYWVWEVTRKFFKNTSSKTTRRLSFPQNMAFWKFSKH